MQGLAALWRDRELRIQEKLCQIEAARVDLDRAFEDDAANAKYIESLSREFDRHQSKLSDIRLEPAVHFRCSRQKPGHKSIWQEVDLCCEADSMMTLSLITLSSEPSLPQGREGMEGATIWPDVDGNGFEILVQCRPKRYISDLIKIMGLRDDAKPVPALKGMRKFKLEWKGDLADDELYSKHFAEIEETIGVHLTRFKRRKVTRVKHVTVLWGLQRIAYDKSDGGHESELLKLWELYSPDEPLESRVSPQWKQMGFQGNDPATDFRGMGLLGLTLLNFMAEHRITDMRDILGRHQDYPFAAAAINIANLMFGKLNFTSKTDLDHLYHSSPEFDTPLMEFFCRIDDDCIFEEVFVTLMVLLDAVFIHMHAGYMQFPEVLKRASVLFDELMQVHVLSIDQLRFLVQQRIQGMNTQLGKPKSEQRKSIYL